MKQRPIKVILSCEHAVNTIPSNYQKHFTKHQEFLNSHRGIDFGAESIAESISKNLGYPLLSAKVSRFLIDFNRTLHASGCFSEATELLSKEDKQAIIDTYYLPYRRQLTAQIKDLVSKGFQVAHLSIHSFTPVYNGIKRQAEIGLLYDPKRPSEKKLAYRLQRALKSEAKDWRTRLNYPYKGIADGFTTTLRTQFPDDVYMGIEIESNQGLTLDVKGLARLCAVYERVLRKLGLE